MGLRTLSFSVSCNSFVCHSYEKCRGVHQLFPFWNSSLFAGYSNLDSTTSNLYLFILLRTLLHAPKTQLLCFQAVLHSFAKTAGGGGTLALTENQNEAHRQQNAPDRRLAPPFSSTGHGSRDTAHSSSGCRPRSRVL